MPCVYPFRPGRRPGLGRSHGASIRPGPEYAQSARRARLFDISRGREYATGRCVRLNYADDMRYGVLAPISRPGCLTVSERRQPRNCQTS